MSEKFLYVFGVPEAVKVEKIVEKFREILKNRQITSSECSRNANGRNMFRFIFDNLDDKDVQKLNDVGRTIDVCRHSLSFIINDEICPKAMFQMPSETWQCVLADYVDTEKDVWRETVKGLTIKRHDDNGPYFICGPVHKLAKFESKCKELLNSKFSSPKPSAAAASSDHVQTSHSITDQVQGSSSFSSDQSQQPSVRQKTKKNAAINGLMGNISDKTEPLANSSEPDPQEIKTKTSSSSKNEIETKISPQTNDADPKNFIVDETNLELMIGSNLKIIIAVGGIDQQQVGAIVNPRFERNGGGSPSKLGSNVAPIGNNGVRDQVVGATDYFLARNLPCKYVIDVSLPSYLSKHETAFEIQNFVQTIKDCYSNCFIDCKFLELRSIAFQPLGHELIDNATKHSADAAAKAVYELIQIDYFGTINEIRFVHTNADVVRCFVRSFYDLKNLLGSSVDVKILSPSSLIEKEKRMILSSASRDTSQTSSGDVGPSGRRNGDTDEKMDTTDPSPSAPSASAVADDDVCSICLCEMAADDKIEQLSKCKHKFHSACIERWMMKNANCALCQVRYGPPKGTQPPGTVSMREFPGKVPGYNDAKGWIEIFYHIPNGIQGPEHPHPGQRFTGANRAAYLPNNKKGQMVAKLLRLAFDYRIIFTVGTSATTGVQNTVVWNNIHHKTSMMPGPFGYPDDTYLDRVEEELKSAGVEKSLLN